MRDARGFATKFYTEEGNYDLVGNNIPVFFIQDAIKFPDLVHAFKPEPHNEMPQAATAHDTFWDFVANNPESAHMVMWTMSDRGIPRSYRMMEGFGVHTFRFVNEQGKARFVKFHWKPVLGVHSLVWDEAQKIAGKDPDFHRRDLWETIENGGKVEYELGVQMIDEEDEFKFDFDILDPTKLWPEELVPVKIIGKMTLNRNQDNVFAETEQVAFHPGNVVPGIDFTNDPLLQGRLFSYTDTQLIRLGGPNFHEIPINRPVCPFHNNQYDGYHRMTINKDLSLIIKTHCKTMIRRLRQLKKAATSTIRKKSRAKKSASEATASTIISHRRSFSGTACLLSRNSISFLLSASRSGRSKAKTYSGRSLMSSAMSMQI